LAIKTPDCRTRQTEDMDLIPAANGGQGKSKGQENWVQPFKPNTV